jgi:hypothetical protein
MNSLLSVATGIDRNTPTVVSDSSVIVTVRIYKIRTNTSPLERLVVTDSWINLIIISGGLTRSGSTRVHWSD